MREWRNLATISCHHADTAKNDRFVDGRATIRASDRESEL